MFPGHGIGMAAQAIVFLIEMDFMVCVSESPERSQTGDTTAYDSNLFSGHSLGCIDV